MIDALLTLIEDRTMKMQLDNKISAGDFARDLAAIGYVIYPNGTITRRGNVLPYRRGERECREKLAEFGGAMNPGGGEAAWDAQTARFRAVVRGEV